MSSDLKRYIHEFQVDERCREDLTFSDASKIRMYSDPQRLGVRLHGVYNKWSKKAEFSLEDGINVRFPEWKPQAVKKWLAFQGVSNTPDNTTVHWRVNVGGVDLWYSGSAWVSATTNSHWNTDIEVSAAIQSLACTNKKIRFIARLKTTDKSYTPVLLGYKIMIEAQFDYWDDLINRSIVPRISEDFDYISDFSARLPSASDRFNVKTDDRFKPEQDMNVIGIDAVYNHDSDPNHNTNILSTFNPSTGLAVITSTLAKDTRLYILLRAQPKVIVSFPNTDYYEFGATPEVIVEVASMIGEQVDAIRWMADRARNKAYKMSSPKLFKEVVFNCQIWIGSIKDSMRMLSKIDEFHVVGSTERVGHRRGPVVSFNALDIYLTLRHKNPTKYAQKPDVTDLKTIQFSFAIENFYVWPRPTEDCDLALAFNHTINRRSDVGPSEEFGVTPELEAGTIPTLYNPPEIEECDPPEIPGD